MTIKFKKQLDIIKKNKNLNFFLSIIKEENNLNGHLENLTFAIKDNFNYINTITTGGSLFLENYYSPYNSTVVELLIKSGAKPICKANMDEFGLGGTGLYSGYGHVINPIDSKRIPGGSSSGSAVATKIDACDFALGTDTGDSIRKPASYLGIIGYKPTYGLISRYGVLPYSPSLDHVGLFSKKIEIISQVMNVIAKYDEKDFTSQINKIDFTTDDQFKFFKVGIIDETFIDIKPEIKKQFMNKIKLLKKLEIAHLNYNPKLLDLIPITYNILSYSEAVSCYQNMSTVTFGPHSESTNFEESAIKARSKLFGSELKRRFLIGAYCTSHDNYEKLFLKSAKVRTKIIIEYRKLLENNDVIISLGSSDIAPLVEDVERNNYQDLYADLYLQIANFGGFPSITVPFLEIDNNPIGINITGKINDDVKVLTVAKYIIETLEKSSNHA